MTVRTITEITDIGADGDTITQITIGPRRSPGVVAEVTWEQWAIGERDRSKIQTATLSIVDASALRDALNAAIVAPKRGRR